MSFQVGFLLATTVLALQTLQAQTAQKSIGQWQHLSCRELNGRSLNLSKASRIDEKSGDALLITRSGAVLTISFGDMTDELTITTESKAGIAAVSGARPYPATATLLLSANSRYALYTETAPFRGGDFPLTGQAFSFACYSN